ncbi:28S ribosomal protein S18c [Sarcoptes scabiei]|uniref:28S ribosomal protein S18c, mitochondrial n=1 Tax=Sarcoptes scabiei TaxID=52283 RepID=A0A834RDH7_SARSC|nr:28S ribosomal protein S18c [Sarcoptes scabiei]
MAQIFQSIQLSRTSKLLSFALRTRLPTIQIVRNCSTSQNLQDDQPDPTLENPYLKEKPQCILCKYNIQIDYKNIRLISQFVSPYTGRLYDKHITGLCEAQHRALRKEFIRAAKFGLISPYYRDPKYNDDPKLFDPTRPQRVNPY